MPDVNGLMLTIASENLASRGVAERAGYSPAAEGGLTAIDYGAEVPAVRYRLRLVKQES